MDGRDYKIARQVRRIDVLGYWLPAAAWSAVLLLMSGSAGSSSLSERILHWIFPMTGPAFDVIHYIARKSVHVMAYALLGALHFRALRGRNRGWQLRWSIGAVALAILIAALDEWHQSQVPGRTGMASDVVIDGAGAVLAQIGYRHTVNG